jgi:hypothetical protein
MAKKNCINYKGKTYTKKEFEQYLKDNDLKDIVSKINGTAAAPIRIGGYEVSEEKINRISEKIKKGLPVSANDPADLFLINKLVFGLTDEKAETAAIVADRMLKAMGQAKNLELATRMIAAQEADNQGLVNKLHEEMVAINPYQNVFYTKNMGSPNVPTTNQNNQEIQENPFLDAPQSEPHGAVQIFDNQNALIYAISNPNVTTPLHELAHVFEQYLTEEEQKVLRDFSEKKDKRSVSETFARGFEKYLADGKAPDESLQDIFNKFNTWLKEIYFKIKGSPIDIKLNDPMKAIYAKMLGIDTPSLQSDSKESNEPEMAISGERLTTMADNEFAEIFADEEDVTEDDPMVFFQNNQNETPNLDQVIKVTKKFKAWAEKSILAGKFDVRNPEYTATAMFNAIGKNASEVSTALGLNGEATKEAIIKTFAIEAKIILEKAAPNTKEGKWKDGEIVPEENRKELKNNPKIKDAAAIARKDKEFDKLKNKIVSGKLMNHGSSGDITADIFFLNEFRRKYFNSREITPVELNLFLMNNKEGQDVDFKAVQENFKAAFSNGEIRDIFLGGQRVIDGQIQPNDVHAVAARYLFDEDIDEETRAFILAGTPPRTRQPREVAEAFVANILKNLKRAAYEAADKEKGGTASTVEKNRRYKEELLEMAKMDRILSMMSNMSNGKNTAVEVMSKLGNNDNNTQVIFEETEVSSASGTELLLLTHIVSELRGLGSKQEAAQVANLQSRLAAQYGRAISYLRALTDGKTFTGKALVLQLTRKAIEAKNTRKGAAKSDVNKDQTTEETLQDIANVGTPIVEESKEEFGVAVNKEVDKAFGKIKKKGLSRKQNDADVANMAKTIADKLSDKEKQDLINELQKRLDDNVKMQDSVTITDKLLTMALEEVVKERIAKGYPSDFDSKEVKDALYQRYNELMNEVASMLEDGKLTKEGGQAFRKKFGVAKNYQGLMDGIKEPFNEAFNRNKPKLEEQVQEVRDAEKFKLIESIGRVGTQNKKVSQATKAGQVKGLIQRGRSNKDKMAKERQKQISNTSKTANPQVAATFEKSILDMAELLHNVVAQANELGVNLDYTELSAVPYSVFNNQNLRALVRELSKSGLKGQALIDEIFNNFTAAIETTERALWNDPIQMGNPNNKENIDNVIELLSDAASDILNAYELDFISKERSRTAVEEKALAKEIQEDEVRIAKKIASDEAKLGRMITAEEKANKRKEYADNQLLKRKKEEQDRIEKKRIDEEAMLEKLLKAELERIEKKIKKENDKIIKAMLVEQKKRLAELTDKQTFTEKVQAFTKAVDNKANKSNVEKLIDKLEEEPKSSQIFTDFVNSITNSEIKAMVESDFTKVGETAFEEITDYLHNNIPKGKERTEIYNELKKKYTKSRSEHAAKSGLTALATRVKNESKDKDAIARLEAQRKADAINMITSGNIEFITPYHLKLVRDAISTITDANLKKELTELVNSIEQNAYESKSDSVMDSFVEILTGIQRRKGGISGQAGTQTAKEKLIEDFSRNEADINAIMEAREEYRSNNPDGEKLAMLDDMLSKLLGKSVGQAQVRAIIKEMLTSENEEAIKEGKKTIANILKDFYNNEDSRENFRPKLEDFIKESTGITDQETIDEIIKVFNESYDKVWNENKKKQLEAQVDTILRADLNKADSEVARAQSVYDNDKSKENKQVLDRAIRNQKAAKRNYERILRHAPKLPFLAEAIREGMPNNDEFKELFYQAFGLTPFSDKDAKLFADAANMITSTEDKTKKDGYLLLRRLMKRYSSAGDFLSVLDIDSLYKMNILSGIGSAISAYAGGYLTQLTSIAGMVASVLEYDVLNNLRIYADNSKNKELQRQINFKVSRSISKAFREVAMSVPYGLDKAAQVIIRGETDGSSLNELESMLTHADRTIADYVMSGYSLSPMLWADIITSSEMTPSEVIDRLGLTPDQRISFAAELPNLQAQAQRAVAGIHGSVAEAIWDSIKSIPEIIARRAKVAAINARIAYKGFSFKNMNDLKDFMALLSDLIEDKGLLMGSLAAGAKIFMAGGNKMFAGVIRSAMYLPVIGNRALASADIVTNGVLGSGTRLMVTTLEAIKINDDYQRKKQGFARIQKELDSKLSNDPNFDSNDAYAYLIAQKEMSKEDKQVLNTIVTNSELSEDDKIYELSTYINGENNPISLSQAIWRELTDADKKIITNLLQGKDKDGKILTRTENGIERDLNESEITDQIEAYLSGRPYIEGTTTFKSWNQDLNDSLRGRDEAYEGHNTIVSRLIKRGAVLEERANPTARAATSQYQGELAMNHDVSGRIGYWQRQFSNISGRASARMRKRRITGEKGSAGERVADITTVVGLNFLAALPRMVAAQAKWQQVLLPFSLWQLRLMDISDKKDGSVMGYYRPDPKEYFRKYFMYVPLQWRDMSPLDNVKAFTEANFPYQWRTETRKVVGKKKVGEEKGDRFVVESKDLSRFVLNSYKGIMAYTTMHIVARMLSDLKDKQTCISNDGKHVLTWGHPDCADCKDCKKTGTYKDNPPPLIVTGGGYANQGQKYKANSVYKLVMKPVLDSNGKQIYVNNKPLEEPDYVWVTYWNLDPINSALYSDMGYYRDRVLEAQQKNGVGIPIEGTRVSDFEYYPEALFSFISKIYNSSGVIQATDDLGKKAKNIMKLGDLNSEDEVKRAEAAKALNDLAVPLGNYTPFMNAMGNDVNKWMNRRVTEVNKMDKWRNASATIAFIDDVMMGGDRRREYTPIGTRKEPNFRYDSMKMNELRTEGDKAIDKKVFGTSELKVMTFSAPSVTNIARPFKTAGGNVLLAEYFNVASWKPDIDLKFELLNKHLATKLPTARIEMMHQQAQGYKQKYITDETLYKIKGTKQSVSIEEAMNDYSDFVKVEILQSINRYGNNRAQFNLLFDMVYDSNKVTEVYKDSSIKEPLDSDKEKARAKFLSDEMYHLVLPESVEEGKISGIFGVPKGGKYSEYPEYSIGALVKWMALNGVAIKDGEVIYKKPIDETRLLGLDKK